MFPIECIAQEGRAILLKGAGDGPKILRVRKEVPKFVGRAWVG